MRQASAVRNLWNHSGFRRYLFVVGFLIVPLAIYGYFVISPYVQAFNISLTSWNGIGSTPKYIGFENFTHLFKDDRFKQAVGHHLVLLLAMPLITLAIALFLAFMLNVAGGTKGGLMSG